MHHNLELLVTQWDKLSKQASGGYARIDCLNWFNYTAFDIIGDLAFGAPFGMLEKGKDIAEVRESPDKPPRYAPAIEVLNRRGEVSGTIGIWPAIKPYAKYLPDPFFSQGVQAVQDLAVSTSVSRNTRSMLIFIGYRHLPCQATSRQPFRPCRSS